MIKSSRAEICSLSSTPGASRTPLPHLCAHLTPYATVVMGVNATHHLFDKVRAASENLINGNTLHKGLIAHIVVL